MTSYQYLTPPEDRIEAFLAACPPAEVWGHIRRQSPSGPDEFIEQLYVDLSSCIAEIEAIRHQLTDTRVSPALREGEEKLRSRLVQMLRRTGYDARPEADYNGHTDILVESRALQLIWLGECKVHGAYEELAEGMRQLHTRYSSGRHHETGLIVFCYNQDALSVVKSWAKKISDEKLCNLIDDSLAEPTTLQFRSTHKNESSGMAVSTMHFFVVLHYSPQDKSAVSSRSKTGASGASG